MSGRFGLVAFDVPNRKHRALGFIEHKGGGWYTIECMGSGKRCAEGTCTHIPSGLKWSTSSRLICRVPRRRK